MKRLYPTDIFLACLTLVFAVACSPQFNKEAPTEEAAVIEAAAKKAASVSSAFDPNTTGGGALGTSSSFRLSGVNVGYTVKKVGTSAGYTVKGGIDGKLTQ